MRILYIGRTIFPGGDAVAHRIVGNAKLFALFGHKLHLLGLCEKDNGEGSIGNNINYNHVIVPVGRFMTTTKDYEDYLHREKYDIVVCYNFPSMPLWHIMRMGHKFGYKTVVDCTEWYMPTGSLVKKTFRKFDIDLRMKYLQKRADGLIVISSYLEKYYKGHRNMILLPPLVDKSDPQWEKRSADRNSLNILFAGTIGFGNKDRLDWIVETLSLLKTTNQLNVNIYGITKEEFICVYPQIKIIPSYIKFHGKVSHDEVVKALKEADFQIFFRESNLSNNAGFPTKFAESISAGARVITNATSDLPEIIDRLHAGYIIDLTSKIEMQEKLNEFLSKPLAEIRKEAQLIDTMFFDYHRYAKETEIFFNRLETKK